jgi:hypothetical protein
VRQRRSNDSGAALPALNPEWPTPTGENQLNAFSLPCDHTAGLTVAHRTVVATPATTTTIPSLLSYGLIRGRLDFVITHPQDDYGTDHLGAEIEWSSYDAYLRSPEWKAFRPLHHDIIQHLMGSQLLLGGFRSAVPGLGEIGNRGALLHPLLRPVDVVLWSGRPRPASPAPSRSPAPANTPSSSRMTATAASGFQVHRAVIARQRLDIRSSLPSARR